MPLSSNYNAVDRALHYLAFSAPFVQKALCDLENDLFKRQLEDVSSRDEVFITGLPRAGTTLLLELLYGTGEFETFTYRHMPFILAPMIWNRIARAHYKHAVKSERAHGDGVGVSFDSPEAFEEVVWLAHLKGAFVGERTLAPISPDMISDRFASAMHDSVRKVLALSLRASEAPPRARYLSKNNANLSRIEALKDLFPTSTVLVVFRNPAAHVSSLMAQHGRFSREHSRDVFSRRYMEWIGHYEFGENFKPINFAGWLDGRTVPAMPDETFWLRYWTAAYTYALERRTSNVHFIDFDRLLEERARYLASLAEALALDGSSALTDASRVLRAPTTKPIATARCEPGAWRAAREIHARLRQSAL